MTPRDMVKLRDELVDRLIDLPYDDRVRELAKLKAVNMPLYVLVRGQLP